MRSSTGAMNSSGCAIGEVLRPTRGGMSFGPEEGGVRVDCGFGGFVDGAWARTEEAVAW